MRNRWLISFIVAIVVLAGAAALITLGFVQMTPKVHTQEVGFFRTMQFSYSTANYSLGYAFIFLGGVLIIAGVLLFILSEVIRSHEECCDCCDADFIDNANWENEEDSKDSECQCGCNCHCNEEEKSE